MKKISKLLMLSIITLLSINFSSCSKDDDEIDNKPNIPDIEIYSFVGGAWLHEEVNNVGDYTIFYYDVYSSKGTMREYLVWKKKNNFEFCTYKDYDWKLSSSLYYQKPSEAVDFGEGERFKVTADGFYKYNGSLQILYASRIDISKIEEWIKVATPEL